MMRRSNFSNQVTNALAWMKERVGFSNWMQTIQEFTTDTCEGQDPFVDDPWKSWMIEDIQEMEEDYRGFIDDYNEFFDLFNTWRSRTMNENALRKVLRKIIFEFGESDAEVIRQSQNREKMIGIGMDGGTIGFDPNWDYASNRPLKPKRMHRLKPELQLVADIIKNDFEELELMPGRNGGPPDMFYFTMIGSGIRARCDYKSYSVQKYHSDFTGDGCFISTQNPEAVKDAFEVGAETSTPADIKKLLEDFIDFAENNIQEDSVWMTFAPAS